MDREIDDVDDRMVARSCQYIEGLLNHHVDAATTDDDSRLALFVVSFWIQQTKLVA